MAISRLHDNLLIWELTCSVTLKSQSLLVKIGAHSTGQRKVCQRLVSRLLPCFSHAQNSVYNKGGRTLSSIAVLPHAQVINKIMQPMHTNIHVFFKCTSGHMFYLWFIQLLPCPVLVYTKLTYGNKISVWILLFVGLCSK